MVFFRMLAMQTSWIRWNFDQDEFQFTWINSDTLRICYSVNGAQVTLLSSGIYKHMKRAGKRAATHLFKRQNENHTKLSNFYFDLRPPGADPRARQRSENPTPGATEMCESPRVARGGMVRLGIDWYIIHRKCKLFSSENSLNIAVTKFDSLIINMQGTQNWLPVLRGEGGATP